MCRKGRENIERLRGKEIQEVWGKREKDSKGNSNNRSGQKERKHRLRGKNRVPKRTKHT